MILFILYFDDFVSHLPNVRVGNGDAYGAVKQCVFGRHYGYTICRVD